jgi:acyl-coenzyme A synthetase/AMP-(fatty) acid ligase
MASSPAGSHAWRAGSAPAVSDPAGDMLDRLCLDHIARFKCPRHYRFVDALPKNNYGKVLKTELRRLLSEEIPSA